MERTTRARTNDQQTTPVTLGTAARRILRQKFVVLVSVLIFAVIGAVFGLISPNAYEAKAVVNVSMPASGANLRAATNVIDMDTEESIAGSRVVIQAAADQLGVDYSDLKASTKVAGHSNSTILDVTVTTTNAERSAEAANAIATAYLDHRKQTILAAREETRANISTASAGMDQGLVNEAILSLFASNTDVGTIITEASAPKSATSFSIFQTLFIGAAAGLLIGIFAAYVVDRTTHNLGYAARLSEISNSEVAVIARGNEEESANQLIRRLGAADGNLTAAGIRGLTIYSPTPRAAASLTTLLQGALVNSKLTVLDPASFNSMPVENIKDYTKANAPVIFDTPASASLAKTQVASDNTKYLLLPFTAKSTVKSTKRVFAELSPSSSTKVIPVFFESPAAPAVQKDKPAPKAKAAAAQK
ncbi:Wzz/FepE/Etk N-terminal domain-containing protein [Rothia nasimurium]|uniref:Wzz/FepE/Etk N-terminal domain-containing protein n=1 Tax=Rothia nasimurium TaxID=85336 RepID=UPI003BA0FA2F